MDRMELEANAWTAAKRRKTTKTALALVFLLLIERETLFCNRLQSELKKKTKKKQQQQQQQNSKLLPLKSVLF